MGARLVRPFLGPENGHRFGNRFVTDPETQVTPERKHKLRQSKNLGQENDGSTQVHSMAPVDVNVTALVGDTFVH